MNFSVLLKFIYVFFSVIRFNETSWCFWFIDYITIYIAVKKSNRFKQTRRLGDTHVPSGLKDNHNVRISIFMQYSYGYVWSKLFFGVKRTIRSNYFLASFSFIIYEAFLILSKANNKSVRQSIETSQQLATLESKPNPRSIQHRLSRIPAVPFTLLHFFLLLRVIRARASLSAVVTSASERAHRVFHYRGASLISILGDGNHRAPAKRTSVTSFAPVTNPLCQRGFEIEFRCANLRLLWIVLRRAGLDFALRYWSLRSTGLCCIT